MTDDDVNHHKLATSPHAKAPSIARTPVSTATAKRRTRFGMAGRRTANRSAGPPQRAFACVMGDMDLVRPLGLAGIPCAVVADSDSQAFYSRFTRTAVRWRGDFWEGTDRLLDDLVRFGAAQAERPILFYQQDSQLLFVSRNRERLAEAFRFVVPDSTLVETLVDKERFQALAEREGLPVPKARLVDPKTQPVYADLDLRFPVIVKPLGRRAAWSTLGDAAKAVAIENEHALSALWPQLAAAGMELLIQDMVPGPESQVESYHVYVDGAGDIVADFTGRKIRTFPLSCGRSTAVTTTAADDVAAMGRDLVRRLDLTGVAKIDFKRAPDGRLHLLEINPRFNLWHHLGAAAGVNLPALVYADLLGQPRPEPASARSGVCWCQPKRDWHAAKASGMSLSTWFRWALRCEAKSVFLDDPLPYLLPLLTGNKLLGKLAELGAPEVFPPPPRPQGSVRR